MVKNAIEIVTEYDDGKEGLQIPCSLAIYKNNLLDEIREYAKEKKII